MKYRNRLLIDLIMAVLLVLLMKYEVLGSFLHELIGTILLAAFAAHLIFNRKYVSRIFNIYKNSSKKKSTRVGVVLNLTLMVCAILMIISSLVISRELFSFLNLNMNYDIWRFIHVFCACVMIAVVVVHVLLHWKAIGNCIKNELEIKKVSGACSIGMRIIAGILAIVTVKISIDNAVESVKIFDNSLKSGEGYGNSVESSDYVTEYYYGPGSETQKQSEPAITSGSSDNGEKITTPSETSKESLNDYLGKLFCTGCSKRCSLLSPKCGKGEAQKTAAITQYNNM